MKTKYQIRTKVKVGVDFYVVTLVVSRKTFMRYYRKENYEIEEINGTWTIFVFYHELSNDLTKKAFDLAYKIAFND